MTVLTINPETQTFADMVGQPYTHTTFDGQAMTGTVEIGVDGLLIVRFAGGRWAYCSYVYEV